jgi:antitoxin (DNA-binding transcriptional repressor) of toxin-antitoxin stability system
MRQILRNQPFSQRCRRVAAHGEGRSIAIVVTCDYNGFMRVVGVRELKARLSEYLRAVRAGEVFLVTDRDRVVAELRPPRSVAMAPADPLAAAMEALLESGQLAGPRVAKEGWTWRARGAGLEPGTAERLLDELRSERDRA